MLQLIDELKTIPGVVGACIYGSDEGVLATNLPSIFRPQRLETVGKHLGKLYSAGQMSFDDLTDVSLHYDESVVVARELRKNQLIFAICDPTFNHNLLTMSFNLLQEELEQGRFAEAETPVAEAADGPGAAGALPCDQPAEELQELLGEMREKLGKVLGPMAGFIFDEAAEAWQKQGRCAISTIEALINLLNQEIADETKAETYRKLIAPALRAFQER